MKHTIIAAALLAAASAQACQDLDVTVLPFEVTYDHTRSFAQLTEDAKGEDTFASTYARLYAAIQGCKVTVGYSPVTVRVASELTHNVCAFEHVLKHEEEHVRIYREALSTLAERVRRHAGSPDLGNKIMDELGATKAQHVALDSPAEYHTNRTACQGRIFTLTGAK